MQTEYVASGDYQINAGGHLLKALLGSCVGVAIFDPEARVGGIIHLLLPEPPSPGSDWSPSSHATTGLPLFIAALLKAGARRENLRAVVAGGALFGDLSERDIALNIGGRCIDRVHAVLREYQIPIIQEESCGLASSTLQLDTDTWRTAITTHFELKPFAVPPVKPDREELNAAIAAVAPIPQTAVTILNLLADERCQPAELIRLIETDQVLAAKTLSLCHSAAFGRQPPVESIDKAVLILGQGHLLSLVATAALDSLLSTRQAGYALQKGGLYKHALAVAHAAKTIAQRTGLVSPGLAYAAGLLHDVGKVGLDRFFAARLPLFYQRHNGEGLIGLERQFLGMDHQEAGLLLAGQWGLPESIGQAIGFHHQPERELKHQTLVALVSLGDLLASRYLSGVAIHASDGDLPLSSRLARLGIAADQLPELIEAVPWGAIMYR